MIRSFFSLTLLVLLSACTGGETNVERGNREGILHYGNGSEPQGLDPHVVTGVPENRLVRALFEGLTVKNPWTLEPEPGVAESWDISEDNLTFTFRLREGVTWHDGTPFTSADVLFTYRMYINPDVPTSYAEDFLQVASAEAPDPYTFRVTYEKPYAPALESWGTPIHPKHLLEGADITKSPLSRSPIGTGPYKFVKWVAGEKIELLANPDYYEGQPFIHRVVYRVIPDTSTQFLELQAGGLDLMSLTPIQYKTQTDTPAFSRNFNKYRYLSFTYTYLGYNLIKPLFQDLRVRQAISYAIDKQEIIDGVLLGLGHVATGPYKPDTWVYNADVKRYDYNPEMARTLLANWSMRCKVPSRRAISSWTRRT
jgi:peptide/nickel transport system substrate-binding protein